MREHRSWRAGAIAVGVVLATLFAVTPAASADGASAASYEAECFGYTGTFRDGTIMYIRHWPSGGDECFGIAPDRTIWHAWPNSGGWKEMPGNGRADELLEFPEYADARVVKVRVVGSSTNWCNRNPVGGVSWGKWYRC